MSKFVNKQTSRFFDLVMEVTADGAGSLFTDLDNDCDSGSLVEQSVFGLNKKELMSRVSISGKNHLFSYSFAVFQIAYSFQDKEKELK